MNTKPCITIVAETYDTNKFPAYKGVPKVDANTLAKGIHFDGPPAYNSSLPDVLPFPAPDSKVQLPNVHPYKEAKPLQNLPKGVASGDFATVTMTEHREVLNSHSKSFSF